jgi:lipid-A-disaccharide synthase
MRSDFSFATSPSSTASEPCARSPLGIASLDRPHRAVVPARHIVATINGPGEVAAWLFPFAAALKERDPEARLTAALLPCVFASGAERRVVAAMDGVDAVHVPRETMQWIARGNRPPRVPDDIPGCVLHFGGELMLSVLLARRLRYPLVVYTEERVRHASLIDKVCVANEGAITPGRRSSVVGNLMVDAAHRRVPLRAIGGRATRTIALFPGSRPYQVKNMLPFLLEVAGHVSETASGLRWVVAQSDFVSLDELAAFAGGVEDRVLHGDTARLQHADGRTRLVSKRGVRVDVVAPGEAMRDADLAVTIPGTNTAELAALGIPMILLLPAYQLHTVPMPGLAGHIGRVPVVGWRIKRAVADWYLRTRRHWAHPNRLCGEHVVPELVGKISAPEVAIRVVETLASPLEETSERLRSIMGPPGGADRLVDEVLATIDGGGDRA